MDLLDVLQIHCIKCQNGINLLTVNQEEHHELICEKCLQSQSNKFIYLNLEIQYYERKIKEISQAPLRQQKKYNQSLDQLQKAQHYQNLTPAQFKEMSKQLNEVQTKMQRQTSQSQQLQLQLLQIEQQQLAMIKKYHSQLIKFAKMEESIAEKQQFIKNLERRQKQLREFSQFVDFNTKP